MSTTLIRSKKLFFLVDDINHKEIYWSSRYQNIHRLITHCSHRPERFHAYGMLMISTKD